MDDIRRDFSHWEVVETFVEPGMCSYLDSRGFGVVPEDVPGSIWNISKEYTSFGIWFKFFCAFARGSDPDTTTEGPKMGEVFDDISGFSDRGHVGIPSSGDSVV